MKMDRNLPENDGAGKYAVINLRKLIEVSGHVGTFQMWTPAVEQAIKTLEEVGALEWGRTGEQDEFFLIKLKDRHAPAALAAYAASIELRDPEFAAEVRELQARSGACNPWSKEPD